MADGDILISIRGDASQLESEVFKAQGALDDLEGSADDTGGSLASMGKSAGQLNTAMKGLSRGGINAVASGISLINPQAAQLIRTLGAMRMLTGPLAVALGVLAAAFAVYKHEMERAAEAAEDAKSRLNGFNDALSDQIIITQDLNNEARMMRGEIDKEGLALEKRKTRIQATAMLLLLPSTQRSRHNKSFAPWRPRSAVGCFATRRRLRRLTRRSSACRNSGPIKRASLKSSWQGPTRSRSTTEN